MSLNTRLIYFPFAAIGELNMMLWAALAMILSERLHDFCSNMPNGESYSSD